MFESGVSQGSGGLLFYALLFNTDFDDDYSIGINTQW